MRGLGRRIIGQRALAFGCALGLALACVHAAPVGRAGEAPTSVVDWLRTQGRDASFGAREALFGAHFPGEAYRGTADQNMRLLEALEGAPAGPAERGGATATRRQAPAHHVAAEHGWRVTLDKGTQVLQLHVPERVVWEHQPGRREEPVLPRLPTGGSGPLFVSAAALGVKAKQFDDGLYAAVEVATQRGHAGVFGRSALLGQLRSALVAAGASDRGSAVVCAACEYGGRQSRLPLSKALDGAVSREKAAFEGNPLRSKPLGFYTWSDELSRIYRQDRMLQTRLTTEADVAAVAAVLRADPWKIQAYQKVLRLAARLTNPLRRPDVLQPPTARAPSVRLPFHVLPPSRSHEVDLAERLWGSRPVPEGANLFAELIPRVRDGSLSLAPRADSGWYDRVTWALEPLLRPEDQPEAARLSFTQGYRDHLEELFKGLLALTRETHVKQLDIGMCGACAPPARIVVSPGLSVEPLATHYRRRADAYRFVRDVLEEAFGAGGLRTLHRLTIDGPVAIDLDAELDLMTRVFDGAAETALLEIGCSQADPTARGAADRAVFQTWRALAPNDLDVAQDCRMMVPVFFDVERRKTKVWVLLGWQTAPLTITYETQPAVLSWKHLPGASTSKPDLEFRGQHTEIAYPVVAEVYVSRLLDRKEFRTHCDRHKTRSAILAALR